MDDGVAKIISGTNKAFEGAGKVMLEVPWWRISTRLSSSYTTMAEGMETFAEFTAVSHLIRQYQSTFAKQISLFSYASRKLPRKWRRRQGMAKLHPRMTCLSLRS